MVSSSIWLRHAVKGFDSFKLEMMTEAVGEKWGSGYVLHARDEFVSILLFWCLLQWR